MQRPSERVAVPGTSAPVMRRESTPAPRAEEARTFTPRPVPPTASSPGGAGRAPASRPPIERSTPVAKGPEDLKAILRSMTTKGSAEREQRQSQNKQSLNGALAEVLEKSGQKAVGSRQLRRPEGSEPRPQASGETPKPVAVEPSQEGKKPFEVPEEALRKVLKGEL